MKRIITLLLCICLLSTPMVGVDSQAKTTNKTVKTSVKKKKQKNEFNLTNREIRLIAIMTMAEAEGESKKGQRLVIDTILNRVKSKHFPNTVAGVLFQQNQFTSVSNGRMGRCYVKTSIVKLVKQEAKKRTNKKVMFFTAGGYGYYGKPVFRVGHHYFCKW